MDAHMPHPGGFSRAMVVASAIALVFLAGCTASSPRFRTGAGTASKDEENELHWSGKIRDEETREDDRKVSLDDVKRVSTPRPDRQKYSNQTPAGIDRDRVLLDVVSYLGAPYAYGGNNKEGIDCSGFTVRVYESAARKQLPRTTREQYQIGDPVEKDRLQFGDLVFFNTTGRIPSHVGIYIEDDLFAHASVTRGVTFSSLESTYYRNRFIGARRVME
jgi:cell wall-associated NlpC family hydrolase